MVRNYGRELRIMSNSRAFQILKRVMQVIFVAAHTLIGIFGIIEIADTFYTALPSAPLTVGLVIGTGIILSIVFLGLNVYVGYYRVFFFNETSTYKTQLWGNSLVFNLIIALPLYALTLVDCHFLTPWSLYSPSSSWAGL